MLSNSQPPSSPPSSSPPWHHDLQFHHLPLVLCPFVFLGNSCSRYDPESNTLHLQLHPRQLQPPQRLAPQNQTLRWHQSIAREPRCLQQLPDSTPTQWFKFDFCTPLDHTDVT